MIDTKDAHALKWIKADQPEAVDDVRLDHLETRGLIHRLSGTGEWRLTNKGAAALAAWKWEH